MPWPWTLRWLVMLLVFAVSSVAFSAYAGASTADGDHVDTMEVSPAGEQENTEAGDETDDSSEATASREDDGDAYHRRDTTTDSMLILTRSAALGAVLGGLVGGSVYVISQGGISPWTIAYFAAGGVLFGATVGAIDIFVRGSRNDRDRVDARLTTFDDALKKEARSRTPTESTLPLLRLSF